MTHQLPTARSAVELVYDGKDLFVLYCGLRIAKRGRPGTPQARSWIPLEPGFAVRDFGFKGIRGELVVEHDGTNCH
jgi:hypothetical protein